MIIVSKMLRGRRLCSAAALVILSLSLTPASAQRVVPEVPTPGAAGMGGAAGVGGGAGLKPAMPMPEMRSAPMAVPAAPSVTPAAPVAPAESVPEPVKPAAPVVKFRCQLDPGAEICREPGAADGGGDDGECSCSRDYCYDDPAGYRVCQKQ
jgi:hypothetical protein